MIRSRGIFLRRLLSLGTSQLLLREVFLRLLGLANSAGPSHSLGAQVCPVTVFRRVVDDSLVHPRSTLLGQSMSRILSRTYFGPDLLDPHVISFLWAVGRLWCFGFLVTRVTPPFSAGWMPTAYMIPPPPSAIERRPIPLGYLSRPSVCLQAYLLVNETGILQVNQ